MKFTFEHFELNNVLIFDADMANREQVAKIGDKLLDDGLYTTCPKVYEVTDDAQKFKVLLPMNREIDDVPDGVTYQELLVCEKCVYTRYLDYDTTYETVREEMQKFADEQSLNIKKVYLVQIQIPGGVVTDVYAEVKSDNEY